MRADVMGSPGDANGILSMTTQLSASPTTSTPCQKLDVATTMAFAVARERRRAARAQHRRARGLPLHEDGVIEFARGIRMHVAEIRVTGEEHEGAASRSA